MDTSNEFGRVAVLALPLCAIGAAWIGLVKSGYVESWIGAGGLRGLMEAAPQTPSVLAWGLGLFVAGALCFVPLEILALCAVVLFGPLLGAPLALVAALIAAVIGYAAGRAIGPRRGLSFTGRRAYRVWRHLPGRGTTAVAALRMVSVFSATSIHLLCGAARVPLQSYVIGTLIAFVPGVLALSLLGGLLRRTILEPCPWSAVLTMLAAGALALIVLFVRRRLLVTRLHAEQKDQAQRAVFG
jgi:uncharacterized membrane protein YdjX (TVP38/TMEM64 family)